MNDYKDIILTILSILIPAIVAILGYIIHRKTEHIKIMESQLSDKKYIAYAGLVEMFFRILKNTNKYNFSGKDYNPLILDTSNREFPNLFSKWFASIDSIKINQLKNGSELHISSKCGVTDATIEKVKSNVIKCGIKGKYISNC